ncbi:MAG: hypothetical protein OXF88_18030 [Rhodobacteraceae bacterium]|nr:hypothetical protein [Paracoccaceae bacterium]MCY4136764.1 hypothetical protein [Paracoccaceae bacterium]
MLEPGGFAHYLSDGGSMDVHLYGDEWALGRLEKLQNEAPFVFDRGRKLFRAELVADRLDFLKVMLSCVRPPERKPSQQCLN